jgi:hypothetical protein
LNLFDSRGGNDYLQNIRDVLASYKIGDLLNVLTNPGQKVGLPCMASLVILRVT